MYRVLFFGLFVVGLFLGLVSRDEGTPLAPAEALKSFQLEDGFRIDLVVAEPLVQDPVAMEVDEQGRFYVVEMPGYPLDVGGSGKVKLLTDTNGDGLPDSATVFADHLTLPTGIMRWKRGILVTDAPDVLYLEDTDGDGRADVRRPVLTGFARSNPQHNFNTPIFGLDNWIYLANEGTIWWTEKFAEAFGGRGAEVFFPDAPDGQRLGRNGMDRNVRFKLDPYAIETRSGYSQFGHTFDAWGRHFMVNNANRQRHEVIAAPYFARNPNLPVARAMQDTPEGGSPGTVYPITRNPQHQLLTDRGVFTSACGITYYLGGAFPEAYNNATFVAEPVHNLIHVDQVVAEGATFIARPMHERRAFLASTDPWFRPVNFYIGPDGALYMIDYYRQIVEHPEWMDDETAASGTIWNGQSHGRIYRIARADAPDMDWLGNMDVLDEPSLALVDLLSHPNIWWRRTAQRLLMDHRDAGMVPLLQDRSTNQTSAEGRVHALWTLDGYGALTENQIRTALQDAAPGVRENAVRLAEHHLAAMPGLASALLALEADPDPKVRFQVLNTLGLVEGLEARAVRHRLLLRDMADPWVQIAALLGEPAEAAYVFEESLAALRHAEHPARYAYLQQVAALVGGQASAEGAQRLVSRITGEWQAGRFPEWSVPALAGLAQGLRRNGPVTRTLKPEVTGLFDLFLGLAEPKDREAVWALLEKTGVPASEDWMPVVSVVADSAASATLRRDALQLLALTDPAPYEATLRSLLHPYTDADVQVAAVHTMGRIRGVAPADTLLGLWAQLTPSVRDAVVDVCMRSGDRMARLLEALEAGIVQPSAIGWDRTVVLMRDTQGEVLERARALLSEQGQVRADVLVRYQGVLERTGSAEAGREVFVRVCATCHQVGGQDGIAFGPDLATVRHWSHAALLTDILDPGRTLADGYEAWTVTRIDGQTISGVVAAETPTTITLAQPGGVALSIARASIAQMQAANQSAMPPGLEAQITEAEMADLLAFLTSN